VSNIFGQISSFYETLIAVIVGILSFPLIGITLDHIGRKPVIIMTIVAVGALSLFFDYPEINVDSITMKAIRIGLFIFAGLLIIILTAVLVGDVSTRFSRGRVMSVILFAVVAGAIIGSLVENNITYNRDALTFEERVRTADWIGLLFLISLAFVTRAKETLQPHSQDWRDFIERIYINTKAGLNVFAYNFKYPSLNRTNTEEEDLVSGGLSGVQSILREISHSNRTIEVLDHGDKKLLFHEGKYTTAVLFTKMDLNVLREKLAQFVNLFEYYNQSELEHFFGNVSKLKQLDTLLKRFFT
jgi:MFS family permease